MCALCAAYVQFIYFYVNDNGWENTKMPYNPQSVLRIKLHLNDARRVSAHLADDRKTYLLLSAIHFINKLSHFFLLLS